MILEIGVIAAAALCAVFLTYQIVRTYGYGRRRLNSEPRGEWRKGVAYAFGRGMMPWEKESAKKHLITYAAGFGYHFGIFSGLFYLLLLILRIDPPGSIVTVLQILMGAGLLFGLGLLIKRSVKEAAWAI